MLIRPEEVVREQMFPGASRLHYIDRKTGAGGLSMGILTLEPHSGLPLHTHLVEDSMIVLEGNGVLVLGEEEFPVSKGMGLIAPANIPHCIRNDSEEPFTIVYSWPATDVELFIVKK